MEERITADADDLAVVLVDAQPYFLDSMHGALDPLIVRLEQLLIVTQWFSLPVICTLEEPVDRKGKLPARLQRYIPESGQVFSKQTYDLCREPSIETALGASSRKQVAVAGGETDVCVLQSVLGLLTRGYTVFLLEDCLYSSAANVASAMRRMMRAGAIGCSYKSLFYELCITEDPARWERERAMAESRGFIPVESLPPRESEKLDG